jgi:hypothetical protein
MSDPHHGITREEFEAGRKIRFGQTNPERIQNPFWEKMIASRADPYWVGEDLGIETDVFGHDPVWCFSRLGQSATFLPKDEGVIFIGGEHEDGSDPNFAIYNDVVIRSFNGSTEIFGYPREVFQPTDFHTATLVDNDIYIIGNVGYMDDRIIGTTPVYKLELATMQIHEVKVPGHEPGWISRHEALYWKDEQAIVIWGGKLSMNQKGESKLNTQTWALHLTEPGWEKLDSLSLTKSSSRWMQPWD